jgi:hypothetical protein
MIAGGVVLLTAAAVCSWLYFYTADLPSIAELRQYDPATASEIHVRGGDSRTYVVPSDRLGKYLRSALVAAEGRTRSREPIRSTTASLLSDAQPPAQMYSWQLARGLAPKGHTIGKIPRPAGKNAGLRDYAD